jgi:hypothetical protein
MISVPSGVRVWLATADINMRKGFGSLALLVQETFKRECERRGCRGLRVRGNRKRKAIEPRRNELSPKVGDGALGQAPAVWGSRTPCFAATSNPSENFTPWTSFGNSGAAFEAASAFLCALRSA